MFPLLLFLFIAGCLSAQKAGAEGLSLINSVRMTLTRQPDILLQEQQVEISKGQLQYSSGQFDSTLYGTGNRSHDESPTRISSSQIFDITTDTTIAEAGLTKTFRNGVSIQPSVNLTQNDSIANAFSKTQDTTRVDFTVNVPLFKGRGVASTGAAEMAAKTEYEANLLDLRQTVAQKVFNTTGAYWNCLAALKNLYVQKDAEERSRRLLDETKKLIEGGETPAANLSQVSASLASKVAQRITGEQTLVEAKRNLGLAMGCTSEEIQLLLLPSNDFLYLPPEKLNRMSGAGALWGEEALRYRADYLAAQKRTESTRILFEAARRDLWPKLNLSLNLGYAGLDEGSRMSRMISALSNNVPGASGGVFLRYELPIENNQARGILLQRAAAHRQSILTTEDLSRTIKSSVLLAISALENSALELTAFQDAALAYKVAVENEKQKFRLGWSTLLDVIQTEDRLTSAVLDEIAAQLRFANALASLRFQSGTILVTDNDQASVGVEELTTIPPVENRKVKEKAGHD